MKHALKKMLKNIEKLCRKFGDRPYMEVREAQKYKLIYKRKNLTNNK